MSDGVVVAYQVPRALLADYVHLTTTTVPTLERVLGEYRFAVHQDSTVIANLREEIGVLKRTTGDLDTIRRTYSEEVAARERTEKMLITAIKRQANWRRGFVGVVVLGVGVVLLT